MFTAVLSTRGGRGGGCQRLSTRVLLSRDRSRQTPTESLHDLGPYSKSSPSRATLVTPQVLTPGVEYANSYHLVVLTPGVEYANSYHLVLTPTEP